MGPQNRQQREFDEDERDAAPAGNDGRAEKMDVREANENIREAQGEDSSETPVDPGKTGIGELADQRELVRRCDLGPLVLQAITRADLDDGDAVCCHCQAPR